MEVALYALFVLTLRTAAAFVCLFRNHIRVWLRDGWWSSWKNDLLRTVAPPKVLTVKRVMLGDVGTVGEPRSQMGIGKTAVGF